MTAPRLALAIPQVMGDRPASDVRDFALRAETLGFDGLWVSELTTTPILDPLTVLAHCAAVTTKVRLGVAVLLTALRQPLRLAQETATLDQLSGGRLDLGVGLGSNRALYPSFGLPASGRAERFEEGLHLLLELWTEGTSNHQGRWELDGDFVVARPIQRPRPPLWFGARSTAGLRRAVQLGDGWIGSGSEPMDVFAEQAAELREILDERDEPDRTFRSAKRLYLAVDEDERRALRRATDWFGAHYGKPDLASRVAAVGSVERVQAEIDRIAAAGADLVVLNPMFDEPEQAEALAQALL